MRRRLITRGLLGVFLVLFLLITALTAGCGGTSAAVQGQTLATPQGVYQALVGAGQITAGAGNIDLTITVTGDQSKMPSVAQALLGQPIKLSGTYAYDQTGNAAQVSLNAAMAGQSIPVGFETTNGQAWLQFMAQWYQIPANTETPGQNDDHHRPRAERIVHPAGDHGGGDRPEHVSDQR